MDIPTLLLLILLVVLIFLTVRGQRKARGTDILEAKIRDLHEMFDSRLHRNTEQVSNRVQAQTDLMQRHVHEQFEKTMRLIEKNTKEITEVSATGRQMMAFTEQLQSLERTLKNPQRRGMAGEFVLERVIGNVLPPDAYALQHTFKNGTRADAVIFLRDDGKVAVDAKFPLENYTKLLEGSGDESAVASQLQKDIKDRVRETAKYVIPNEGTLDFAFMFVPSESLYYDLLTQKIGGGEKNLLEQAFTDYRVIVVSPTTLLAYLQTVDLGLRSLRVEKHVQEVIARVGSLQRHLTEHVKSVHGIGRALSTAVNCYNRAEQQYDLIDKDVFNIAGEGGEYVRDVLDGPRSREKDA